MGDSKKDQTYLEKLDGFSKAVYNGFILKRNFWFGKFEGTPIALSGHVTEEGKVKVYFQHDNDWNPIMLSMETIQRVFPEVILSS